MRRWPPWLVTPPARSHALSPARLSKPAQLVPPHLSNRDPAYLIVGGLVFVAASEPYLQVGVTGAEGGEQGGTARQHSRCTSAAPGIPLSSFSAQQRPAGTHLLHLPAQSPLPSPPQSEYGSDYGSEAPVKLLDVLYHAFPSQPDQECVVLSQVGGGGAWRG
jgi:hypothetical protein